MHIHVSIIIVHYHVFEELAACISSIIKSNPKVTYEIIVVDNDEEKSIEKKLLTKFPQVKYIFAQGNGGFGAGNNLGAKHAQGDYLFFLNPDTIVLPGCVDQLVAAFDKFPDAGILAPLLLDKTRKPYPLQGTTKLTPINGIICLSFLNKYFPNNPVAKKYWLFSWDKKTNRKVDVMPGSAFMVQKTLFEKVGCFDEQFFLFFEENDLCMRVQKEGKSIYMVPLAKVVHLWGKSTEKGKDIQKIFKKSRNIYFQKYYGAFWPTVVDTFLR